MITFTETLARESEKRDNDKHDTARSVPLSDEEREIERLAGLSTLEYDREREVAAKALRCRTSSLDSLVNAKRAKDKTEKQGRALNLREAEPWPEPVDGAEVLSEISERFAAYVALPSGAADALTLWVAHAHLFDAFNVSPRLNITSPDKRCGKTTLRDVVAEFVPRPLPTENLSVAVLFRVVDQNRPTLLADEYDSWVNTNDELRGLLNAGHRYDGQALRCEGDGNEVRAFSVFGAAALCGIGSLPGTLGDRSIAIRLERAKPGEVRERFDSRHTQREQVLCRKLARFCADNRRALENCDPVLPLGAFNRVADNWRPLFAIAEMAGSEWPARAASAYSKLTCREDEDAQGIGTMLLQDIRCVFAEQGAERIFSKMLVDRLIAITDRPWGEARKSKPITESWLASRLGPFNIHSKNVRIDQEQAKGYCLSDLAEAFARYLDSDGSSRPSVPRARTAKDFVMIQTVPP